MNKIVLITGATGAIGRATALEIAKSGATVVLFARNKIKAETVKKEISEKTGNNNIDILIGDLSDVDSIKNAVKEFKQKYDRLDALLNIAAIYKKDREVTTSNLEKMFATNHMGPFVLTNGLLDLLKASKPSRIITVSAPSTTKIDFTDLQTEKHFNPLRAFGATKMMNLLFTYALAKRLKGTGVTAAVYFPGVTKSDLTKEMPFFIKQFLKLIASKPERAAFMLIRLAINPMYKDSNGRFYKYDKREIPSSPYSYNAEVQEKLWEMSQQIEKLVSTREVPQEAELV